MKQTVDIWVDPLCPWAWMTSQWLLEVEKVRPVKVRYNIMSLSYLNDGREGLSEEYQKMLVSGWGPVRVAIAVEQAGGKDALREFYLKLGTLRHNQKRGFSSSSYAAALEAAGVSPELAAAAEDASLDEALRASHHAGMDPVGNDVGTPVVHFPKPDGSTSAYFGPVITPPPTGEAAGLLWDGLLALAQVDGFYELKRSRDAGPSFLPMPAYE
ncbi:MAG: disulfide bond formation protein DsbA [Thermomicrobiales bacterium]|nr:disulfide bond formation protein DsbA [Thermomicrobiales bacterium]